MLLSPRLVPLVLCASLVPLACDKGKSEGGDKPAAGAEDSGGGAEAKGAKPSADTKKISAIDVGALSSCALLEDGTVRCWGANIEGQLGVGKTADELLESYTPVAVSGVSDAKTLWHDASYSWGGGHSDGATDTGCVQAADGSMKCWGHNGLVFGDGEHKDQPSPTAIASLAGITDYTAASGHACGIWPDKTAKCWGSNAFGVAGIGNDERDVKTPTAVKGLTDAADIDCGQNHCCAIKTDGTGACWGYNSSGQLGDGGSEKTNAPVAVAGLTDATQLAVVENAACVLKKDGTVTCWGSNFGKAPVAVAGATDITQLDAQGFACGLKSDKTVVCWGENNYGQLGDGTREDRKKAAAPVKGLAGVAQISVGRDHACALLEDNSVKCWGKNGRGQLGDGSIEDRLEPVTVVQVGAKTLTPQTDAERPIALPTDKKVAEFTGVPEGCPSTVELEAKVNNQPIPFTVRNVDVRWSRGELGYAIEFSNFDEDENNRHRMPRGREAFIKIGLEKWVIEKGDDGKEKPVQKVADMEQPYAPGLTGSYRTTNSAGIYDNHKQRFFKEGNIKVTHIDDNWVCGEIDLRHEKNGHSLEGKFVAPVPPKKG